MVELRAKNLQPKLNEKDIPNITYEEEVIHVAKDGIQCLSEIIEEQEATKLNAHLIFRFLARQYKAQIWFIVFLYGIEMGCRLGFSIMLQ